MKRTRTMTTLDREFELMTRGENKNGINRVVLTCNSGEKKN